MNQIKPLILIVLSLIIYSCEIGEIKISENSLDETIMKMEKSIDDMLTFGINFDVDTLKQIQTRAEFIYDQSGDSRALVLSKMIDGILERNENEKSITSYLESLDLAEIHNYQFAQGLLYGLLGRKYNSLGEYRSVSKFFKSSLQKWELLNNQPRIGHVLNNLALDFERKRDLDSAIFYFEKAREIFRSIGDNQSIIATNQMLARPYLGKRDTEKAVALGMESVELSKSLGDKWRSSAHQDLAIIYNQSGRPADAIHHFDSAFSIEVSEGLSTQIFARFFQARSYFRTGNIASAKKNMDMVLEASKAEDGSNFKRLHADIYDLMATIKQKEGEHQEAIELLKKRESLLAAIQFDNQKREATRAASKYDAFRAQQNAEEANTKAAQQKRINQFSIFAGAILMLLAFAILSLYIKKRKDSNKIEAQNELITKSLAERESLLKEIHHRVKNNLQIIASLLYLQSGKFEDEDFKKVLEEGQGRVRSMALIHQKLYENEDLKSIPFGEYLEELVGEIRASFGMDNIQLNIEAENIFFDVDTAVPLGLIVNEMATNAFKYAFPKREKGSIGIFLTEEDGTYTLNIKDDGKGIPEEIDLRKTKSLGLRLVRMLSQQLEGDFEFENDNGTSFELKFAA